MKLGRGAWFEWVLLLAPVVAGVWIALIGPGRTTETVMLQERIRGAVPCEDEATFHQLHEVHRQLRRTPPGRINRKLRRRVAASRKCAEAAGFGKYMEEVAGAKVDLQCGRQEAIETTKAVETCLGGARLLFAQQAMVHTTDRLTVPLPCPELVTILALGHPVVAVAQTWLAATPDVPFSEFRERSDGHLIDNPLIRALLRERSVDAVNERHLNVTKELLDSFDVVVLPEHTVTSIRVLQSVLGVSSPALDLHRREVPPEHEPRLRASLNDINAAVAYDLALYEYAKELLEQDRSVFEPLAERFLQERQREDEYFLAYETAAKCARACGHVCHLHWDLPPPPS